MRIWGRALLIGFTYIGTVVGAGFATGQEILQFFTLYGQWAVLSILLSSFLFLWLGTKIMLISRELRAKSYEDLNAHLFGETAGRWISMFIFILLLTITAVMLAGAGAVFQEHFNLSYQSGLLFTALLVLIVNSNGMNGIKTVNSIVVPLMLLFLMIILFTTLQMPTSDHFLSLETAQPLWRIVLSPFVYAAFNLSLAQSVLVPLGATTENPRVIQLGGLLGGIGITIMLLAGHISLSAHMPGVSQYNIPMGYIISTLGPMISFLFILLIFAEIFTTLIANIYGMTLQIRQHVNLGPDRITLVLLLFCYAVSQFGFRTLLSTLYPILGMISLGWLGMLIVKRRDSF
jgi:uncharacterized membrane protein YkvI